MNKLTSVKKGLMAIAAAISVFVVSFAGLPAHGASFDCAKAKNVMEKTICADPKLSKLDEEVDLAYKTAKNADGETITIQQRSWLKKRNACNTPDCIEQLYTKRLEELTVKNKLSESKQTIENKNHSINTKIKWIVFYLANYQKERILVNKYNHITNSKDKYAKVFIAVADLNDDGVNEIFSYIKGSYFCGDQLGCPFNIYKLQNNKLISLLSPDFSDGFPLIMDIQEANQQKVIGILNQKTRGMHDIFIGNDTVWKWTGKSYLK